MDLVADPGALLLEERPGQIDLHERHDFLPCDDPDMAWHETGAGDGRPMFENFDRVTVKLLWLLSAIQAAGVGQTAHLSDDEA
jgi:hypothetical protein